MTHEKVLEYGVVAFTEGDRLLKPKAFVVLQPGVEKKEVSYQQLKDYVKQRLTPWKYPRWIEFVDDSH
ncbi:MAG: AMP-binding enzyme [Arenicellales bacterium WSBS_2016_MAG_OTU3]